MVDIFERWRSTTKWMADLCKGMVAESFLLELSEFPNALGGERTWRLLKTIAEPDIAREGESEVNDQADPSLVKPHRRLSPGWDRFVVAEAVGFG